MMCRVAIVALGLVAPSLALRQPCTSSRLVPTPLLFARGPDRAQFLASTFALLGLPSVAAARPQGPPPLLRLSRAEVSKKLARVPVFYVQRGGSGIDGGVGGVELNAEGVGEFFLEQADADAAAAKLGDLSASAGVAFLGDVYLSLLRKSAKLEFFPPGTLVGRTVAAGHADAPFRLVPAAAEVAAAQRWGYAPPASNRGADGPAAGGGVPLFFVPRVAYQGSGMEFGAVQKPLFLSSAAAVEALVDRARRDAKRDNVAYDPNVATSFAAAKAEVVVLDLADVLSAMLTATPPQPLSPTEDLRALEFFASRAAVEAAQSAYAAQVARGG